MKLGIAVPQVGDIAGREALIAAAEAAEDHSLASLWVSDHVAFPSTSETRYPYSKDGSFPVGYDAPFLEALTTLSFLAARTERVILGTSVLVLPLRNLVLTAKQIATIACLVPDRLILGLGAGWLREEFDALGAPYESRGAVLEEGVAALRGLLSEPGYSHQGEHVSFPPLLIEPRPELAPEIWIGGTTPPALRRAGALGDAWHAIGTRDPDDLRAKLDAVADAAARSGRDPGSVAFTARLSAVPGADGAERLRARLELLAELGCRHAVIDPAARSLDELLQIYEVAGSLVGELGDRVEARTDERGGS